MTDTFPRETVEHLPVKMTVKNALGADITVLVGLEVCIVPTGSRPSGWVAAVSLEGVLGIMLNGQMQGAYTIFSRVAGNPETPVAECGQVIFT